MEKNFRELSLAVGNLFSSREELDECMPILVEISSRLTKSSAPLNKEVEGNTYNRRSRGVLPDVEESSGSDVDEISAASVAAAAVASGLIKSARMSLKETIPKNDVLLQKAPVVVPTSQSSKRSRGKKNIKSLLESILFYRKNKMVVPTEYHAYVKDQLGVYSSAELTEFYEMEGGFLPISLVKDCRGITQHERDVLNVFELLRKLFTKELSTNKNRKLINQPSGGVFSAEYTLPDDLRRAISITFGSAVKSLQILVEYFVQQFINLGFVHPDTIAGNALGKAGLELLFKGTGLDDQVDHFDFPNFQRSKLHLSYRHAMEHCPSTFDKRLDGGCSLFVNHTAKEDHLRRPDGNLMIIPPYSYCILRGNVAHSGTGNSEDDAVYKFFCYLDPVWYHRATNPYKDNGIVTKTEFTRKYPSLAKESLGQIPASESHVQDLLSYKPFLASVKMQKEGYNTVLEYDADIKMGYLKVVSDIEVKKEMILKADPWFISPKFLVDIDEYALKAVIEGEDDEFVVIAASHAESSSGFEVEINGEDGVDYDEDEEYGDSSSDDEDSDNHSE
eukprot:gene21692-27739_t